ncbi:MAG: SAM-dependent methyltransferase, partial [Candidatus Omnitrophica bacterium]|nr:SAM-dependent methyltransferase [Candidatus Omnitrophota bacterium]
MDMHGSFRDPSGFVFLKDGVLYRQVNAIYKEHYDLLMGSGLYDKLVSAGLLIPHYEVSGLAQTDQAAYKIIRPELIPFISYPFEWCFSQLKHAALM